MTKKNDKKTAKKKDARRMSNTICGNPKCGKLIHPVPNPWIDGKYGVPYIVCPHCSAKNRVRDIGTEPDGPRRFVVDGLLED